MVNKKTIAAIALAGALTITGAGAVYAAPGAELQNTQNTELTLKMQEIHKQFKTELDNLVKAGTITRAQEDAVLKAMSAKREQIEEKLEKGKLKGKPEKVKIEKGKPDSRAQKPEDGKGVKFRPHSHPHGHKGFLQDLVKDGTLTKEQAEAIRKAFKSARDSVMQKQ